MLEGEEYTRRLESRVRDEGYVSLGIQGKVSLLTHGEATIDVSRFSYS